MEEFWKVGEIDGNKRRLENIERVQMSESGGEMEHPGPSHTIVNLNCATQSEVFRHVTARSSRLRLSSVPPSICTLLDGYLFIPHFLTLFLLSLPLSSQPLHSPSQIAPWLACNRGQPRGSWGSPGPSRQPLDP